MVVLISDEHGQRLIWENSETSTEDEMDSANEEFEESDRLFDFEVSKANEQEESVHAHNGFSVRDACSLLATC